MCLCVYVYVCTHVCVRVCALSMKIREQACVCALSHSLLLTNYALDYAAAERNNNNNYALDYADAERNRQQAGQIQESVAGAEGVFVRVLFVCVCCVRECVRACIVYVCVLSTPTATIKSNNTHAPVCYAHSWCTEQTRARRTQRMRIGSSCAWCTNWATETGTI